MCDLEWPLAQKIEGLAVNPETIKVLKFYGGCLVERTDKDGQVWRAIVDVDNIPETASTIQWERKTGPEWPEHLHDIGE